MLLQRTLIILERNVDTPSICMTYAPFSYLEGSLSGYTCQRFVLENVLAVANGLYQSLFLSSKSIRCIIHDIVLTSSRSH